MVLTEHRRVIFFERSMLFWLPQVSELHLLPLFCNRLCIDIGKRDTPVQNVRSPGLVKFRLL